MRKFLLLNCFIFALLFVFSFSMGRVLAQTSSKTPEEIAKEKGITFPIAELGNCKNYSECRNFCDDSVNIDNCIAFAKKKGFYKEPQIDSRKDEILKSAKSELGCDNPSSCQAFCSKTENHDKCEAFAKSHNLGGGQTADPSKAQIVEKAKIVLGCDSVSSCKNFCEQEINRVKCSDFAKQVGLRGGEIKSGPGGCISEETCRKFCSDSNNFEVCQKFQGSVSGNLQSFHGPGGCNSPEACKAYCEKNPQDCQVMNKSSNHQEICERTPNCSWNGTTCQCSGFNSSSGTSSAIPSTTINKADYCSQYPERCAVQSPYPSYSPIPSGFLPNQPSSSYAPTQNHSSSVSYPTREPTNNVQPSSTTQVQTVAQPTYDPATQCAKTAGCFWTGSTCLCKSVQGASTQRSLLQVIFQTLLRL